MHRRHSDSPAFQVIRRCRCQHSRSTRQLIHLRHLIRILTRMRRPTTPTYLTIFITLTIRIMQSHIFTVLRLVFFLAIPLTTAVTVAVGIGVIAGTAKLKGPTRRKGTLDLRPETKSPVAKQQCSMLLVSPTEWINAIGDGSEVFEISHCRARIGTFWNVTAVWSKALLRVRIGVPERDMKKLQQQRKDGKPADLIRETRQTRKLGSYRSNLVISLGLCSLDLVALSGSFLYFSLFAFPRVHRTHRKPFRRNRRSQLSRATSLSANWLSIRNCTTERK